MLLYGMRGIEFDVTQAQAVHQMLQTLRKEERDHVWNQFGKVISSEWLYLYWSIYVDK